MQHRIVISYCRSDQHLIRPIAKLLGGALSELERAVYWDDAFRAGVAWEEQFRDTLHQSERLFVFWCEHSSCSTAVAREIQFARQAAKTIVPVLLDNTPLNELLAPIHAVDLRPMRIHRLDPLRTLAPRVVASLRLGLRSTFARGRRLDAAGSYTLAIVTAALISVAWFMIGGKDVVDVVKGAAATIGRAVAYLSILLAVLWLVFPALNRWRRLRSLMRTRSRSGEYLLREFRRQMRPKSSSADRPDLVDSGRS